jgi:ribonuclease BN (tRNA processing enzyme)
VRLTTIGTGTAAPWATRVQPGHLVETRGVRALLDCGSGVVTRFATLGLDWRDLTHIVLTHFHADHVLDLPTLLTAWRYGMLPPRRAPLQIVGPPGTRELVDRLTAAVDVKYGEYGFRVTFHELSPGGALAISEGAMLRCVKVPHTAESVAYSIEADGRRLVYSGDTGYDEELARWAAGCDLFLCECSLPDAMGIASHLTPGSVGALAAIARPRLLALTHLYPPLEGTDVAAAVSVRYAGPVVVAYDGWSIQLRG